MKFISFNPYRTIGIPNIIYIKPENMFREKEIIKEADYVLFPEYWQLNTLVYGLNKKIFPNISTYHLGHNKIEMTRTLWATFPQNVPYTKITNLDRVCVEDIEEEFGYPCVCKEIRNSMGRGVYLVENRRELLEYMNNNEVLYIQEKLPIDRDLRIVYVGDRVVASYWRIGREGAFHNNIAKGGTYSFRDVPEASIKLVENVASSLKINHAGFDIAVVGDKYYILEFNVLFGNEGLNHMGIKVEPLIYEYIMRDLNPDSPNYPDNVQKAS
ncbi:MAG: Ribosomal protein S6--L-glutamate ligase [Sporanaerobacter sp.]|uniref:ATP-grasp domain-containing protein n=1 Tax=Sporanaerobacter sp. TaxID=2010183 RepID=UPI003A0FBC66